MPNALESMMSESYVLYHYASCPFCARVDRFLAQFGIEIERRDTLRDRQARTELVAGGGRSTVPCLQIRSEAGVRWLYESLDIMQYLHDRLVVREGQA
jgi:glutathione S-transferase